MPRQARLDTPGLLHHIIARGIERRPIFFSKDDYTDFLSRIENIHSRFHQEILAWVIMPNHFHLLIRSGSAGVAPFMKRLMTGYAVAFNHRHKRAGHLFQNRYKSIVCEEGTYLMELIRYIHLNPYRAKLVKDLSALAGYPYSGHGVILGNRKCSWQNREEVLALFSPTRSVAVRKYIQFMRDGLNQGRRPDLIGGGLIRSQGGVRAVMENRRGGDFEQYDSRILGSGNFVADVLKSAERKNEFEFDLKKGGIGVEEVARRVAAEESVKPEDLFLKGRRAPISRAKEKLIFIGVEYLGRSNREMALLTRMSDPSASNARRRAAQFFTGTDVRKWLLTN